jgi:hypothetical protein
MRDITLQPSSITSEMYLSYLCHAKIHWQYNNNISVNETNEHPDSAGILPRDAQEATLSSLHFILPP